MIERAAWPPTDRLSLQLSVVIGVFVPLSALPMASNRAVWWLLWAMLLAGVAAMSLWRSSVASPTRVPRVLRFATPFAVALVVPAYALLQSAPWAAALPEALLTLPSTQPVSDLATISVLPGASLAGALRFLSYLILLALVLELADRPASSTLLARLLFAGIVLQAVWALIALHPLGDFAPWVKRDYLGSATGTFVNRNALAAFLGFGLVLGTGLIVQRGARAMIAAGLAMILVALVETGSRAGLAASGLGVAVTLTLIRSGHGVGWPRLLAEGALAVLAMVVGLLVLADIGPGSLVDRLLLSTTDGSARAVLYAQILELVQLRPWTGFGFDAFGPAFEAVRAPPLDRDVYYDLAHNSYLALWSELGLVVGSIPLGLLVFAATLLLRMRGTGGRLPPLAATALGALTLGAAHALVDFSLEIPANVYLFTSLLGLGWGQNPAPKPRQAPDARVPA